MNTIGKRWWGIHPFVTIWLSTALLFGGLLAWAEVSRNRLDDPDPAFQRTGFLLPEDKLRAPDVLPGYPRAGHRLAVLFVRSVDGQMLFHDLALQSDLDSLADIVLVTQDGIRPNITQGLDAIVADRDEAIVNAFGLHRPMDGGYPVGYALVDRDGYIRHRTLDPHCFGMGHNYEIKALLRAIP